MKILMIGSGGREHALIKKLLESPKCTKLYCAPGNGGISRDAELVNIGVMDKENMVKFAKDNAIDLVFVAPDDPLADGMVDAMQEAGIRAFGPNANAAIIEASKAFSQNLMKKDGSRWFYLENDGTPLFLSADATGLKDGAVKLDGRYYFCLR